MLDETPKSDGKKPEQDSLPKGGILDKWAKRSAGLPDDRVHADPSEKDEIRQFYRLGGMSLQIVGTVIVFTLIGYWLDTFFHWHYVAMISLAVIAFVGSMYLFIKEALRINK